MTETTLIRGLGWRPEVYDPRNRLYKAPRRKLASIVLPLGTKARIHDQGMLGSCTGHGATTMLEVYLRAIGVVTALTNDAEQLSRLMAYYTARSYIDEIPFDNGAYIKDAIRGLINIGSCPETSWPYKPAKFATKPSAAAYAKAALFRDKIKALGLVYEYMPDLGGMLAAINAGQPVTFGFTCFNSVFDLTATNDILPMPNATDVPIGGHAVCADGYNMRDRYINVINSWGTGWGTRGRFRMPFAWFESDLTDDMWTIQRTTV